MPTPAEKAEAATASMRKRTALAASQRAARARAIAAMARPVPPEVAPRGTDG